jgi:hypothetical protein
VTKGLRLALALTVLLAASVSLGATSAFAAGPSQTKTAAFAVAGGPCYTGGQICPTTPIALTSLASYSNVTAVFTLEAIHCSDVAVVLFVDGHEVGTTPFAPPGVSTETVTVRWPKDGETHSLSYEGKGEEGGCNGGNLVTWSGSLAVTYTPKKPKKVVLSGTVFERKCAPDKEPCESVLVPATGRAVAVSGAGGDSETEASKTGSYKFKVKRGHYTIRVPGSKGSVKPKSRSVDAQADIGHLNFLLCKEPEGYHGSKQDCGLVDIEGTVVDIDNQPYANATVSAPGGSSAETDAAGHFVVRTAPGKIEVNAEDKRSIARPSNSVEVDATHAVNTAKIKLLPKIVMSQAASASVVAQVGGLPLKPSPATDEFFKAPVKGTVTLGGSGHFGKESVSSDGKNPRGDRSLTYVLTPNSNGISASFCAGDYSGTVRSPDHRTLATRTFTIP